MKKVLLLLIAFTAYCTLGWAQLGVGQQFTNNNFEQWTHEATGNDYKIPVGWHSINDATGKSGLFINYVTLARNKNFIQQYSDSPSGEGSSCVQIKCCNVYGQPANGSLTSGRFNVIGTPVAASGNCTYTSTLDGFNQSLTAYPDSLYIWVKTILVDNQHNARLNIVIHNNSVASNNSIYQDPNPTNTTSDYSVGGTSGTQNSAKEVAKVTENFNTNGAWVHKKYPFNYTTNPTTPSYVLATFATNPGAAEGNINDLLYIDDIVLIYNTRLATLTVDDNTLAGFNADVTSYNYPTPICEGVVPNVAGTCQSAHASTQIMHDPTVAEPYTIIRVKHLNQDSTVYKDYRINYTILAAPSAPTISSTPICAPVPQTVTMTAYSEGATNYRWYTTESGSSFTEGSSFTVYSLLGSATYYVSALNSTGCESSRTPATAIVAASPNAPTANNSSVCSGGTGVFTATLPAEDNLVCRWYATNSSSEVLGTGTSLEVANLTQNTTRYAETYNTVTGCYSGRTAVTVNVNSLPTVPTNLAGGSHCGTGTVSLSATAAAGTVCQWFAAETGGSSLGSGNSFTTPSIASSTNYYVASYNESTGCSSARQMVTATINDIPAAPTTGSTTAVCPGEDGIFTATLPSGDNLQCNWYETSNSTTVLSTATSLNVANLTQNTSRFVSTLNTATGCESDRTEVIVNVKALPDAPTLSGASRCGTGDITLNVSDALNDNTYTWYNANSTQVGTGISYTAENLASTSTYYVTATADGCTGASASVTAIINDVPALPVVTGGANCGAGTVTLNATPGQNGNQIRWFAAEEGGEAIETENSYTTPSLSESTTYYAASYNSSTGCSSARQEVVATINPIPGVPAISGNEAICDGSTLTLTASTGSDADAIRWYDSNGQQVSDNAVFTTPALNSNTTYTAKSYNSTTGCYSAATEAAIVVNEIPGAPGLAGDSHCGTGNVTLNVLNALNDVTYSWYNANDELLGTGSNYTAENLAGTSIYHVTATANGCTGASATVTATINAIPALPAVTGRANCGAGTVTLNATPGQNGNQIRWFAAEEGGEAIGTENSFTTPSINETTTYYVASYNSNTQCIGTRIPVVATINDIPAAPTASNDTLCGRGSAVLTAVPAENCSCQWFNANDIEITTGVGNDSRSLTTGNLSQNTPYRVRSVNTSTSCFSEYTDIQVVVAPVPGAPTVSNNARCGEGDITLTATPGSNANTCRWYNTNNELVYEGTSYEMQDLASTTSFTCKSYNDNTGCESSANNSRTAIATIYPIPAQPTVQGNNPICGSGSLTLTGTPAAEATICRWINGNDIITGNSFNTGELTETTTYYVQSYHASRACVSENLAVTVVVNTLPNAPQTADDTQCLGTPVNLTATATENTIVRWYVSSQDNNILYEGAEFHPENLVVGENNFYASLYDTLTQCTSADRSVATANMIDAPAIPNVADTAHCGPAAFTLNIIDPQPNTTYKWYTEAQGGIATEGTSFTTVTLDETTNYYVSAAVSGYDCESGRKKVTVTINSIPANPVVNGNEAICAGQTLTVSASSDAAASNFVWSDGQNNTEGETFTTPTLSENASYTVKAYNANTNCESEEVNFTVTVNPNPTAPEVSPVTVCQNETAILSATVANEHTGYWYASENDANVITTGDSYTPDNLSVGTTTFFVSQRNDNTNCESVRAAITATVNPTYTVDYPIVACDSFRWNNELFTESGDYARTLHTQLGCDSVVTLKLTINRSVVTNLDTTVCDIFVWNNQSYETSGDYQQSFTSYQNCDSTVNVHLTVKKSTIGEDHIYLCSNELPYNYNNLYEVTTAGTFTIHTDNAAECDSTITLTVTVNTQPSAAINLTPAARCGEGAVTLTAHAGQNGTTCHWYASENDSEVLFTGTSYVINNLAETTTYYVSSYNEYDGHPCESGRQAITATINTNPAEPIVEDQVRCGNGQVEFTATVDENANTCRWYLTQATSNISATGLTYTPNINTTATNGTTFYVESFNTNTNCKSSRKAVKATAFVIPAVPVLTPMSYCGEHQFSITAPASGYYKWYENENSENAVDIENNTTPSLNASRSYFISNAVDYTGISCESNRAELALTIYPVYENQYVYDTICQGETYAQYGLNETFGAAGSFDRVINTVSSTNCDSLVTLRLWVKEIRSFAFDTTVCDTYTWNNETFTESENITRHFTSSIGCDSVVTVSLTVNKSVQTEFDATECDEYTWNNETYNASGNYVQHFFTVNNCDSTVTLHLTINNSVETEFSETACDSYTWNNEVYTESGDKVQHFQTSKGCDSTVTLHLTIHYSNAANLTDAVCAGTRYNANGFDTTFHVAGSYTLVRHDLNQAGCDSTTTLTLKVNPIYNQHVTLTICETALPYTWNDITYPVNTEGGNYEHIYSTQTAAGCDSIVNLHLTISNQYVTPLTQDICEGESITFANQTLSQSGIYYDTLQASNHCDSIIMLTLTVHELHTTTLEGSICLGESYTSYDFNVTPETSGPHTYQRVVQTAFGCDSTIILNLTVNPVYFSEENGSTCDYTEYIWNGHNKQIGLLEAGNYIIWDSLKTVNGCDSVFKLNLTVNPSYFYPETATVCDNEEYVWEGHNMQIGLLSEGTYTIWDSLKTVNQCDSVYQLTLTVNPTFYTENEGSTCANEAYVWQGHEHVNIGLLEAGEHIIWDSLKTVNQCDSVYKLSLTVYPTFYDENEGNTCANEVYVWQGHEHINIGLLEAGEYIIWDSLETVNHCDSVYKLTLTVTPTFYEENEGTICDNEAYVWQGHEHINIGIKSAGEYIIWDSLYTDTYACDSVYKLTLTVNETKQTDLYESICAGDYFEYNDAYYEESGDFDIHFQTALGCDSTVTLHLTVNPVYSIDTNITVCQGMMPYNFADTIFTTSGSKDVLLHTQQGCDSIYHVNLTVTPFITTSQTITICDNELPYHFLDSTFYAAGTYDVTETFEDGCNRITTLTLVVNPTFEITVYETACASYTLDRGTYQRVLTESGIYTDTLSTIHGCDSIVHLNLTINPTFYFEESDYVCDNETYVWQGHEYINIDNLSEGIYTIWDSLKTVNECDSVYKLTLKVTPTYHFDAETATVCESEEYVWAGHEYIQIGQRTAGNYTIYDSLHTATYACDSVHTLILTVTPIYSFEAETATICDNEEYVWAGHEYIQIGQRAAGTYTIYDSLHTATYACDSVHTLVLTVTPTYHFDAETATVCENEEYVWAGHEYIQIGQRTAGTYTIYDSLHTATYACDSVHTLILTVTPVFYQEVMAHTCDNEAYVWEGHNVEIGVLDAGVYTIWDSLTTTTYGCDSVYMLTLTVTPTFYAEETDTVCDNEVFVWEGHNVQFGLLEPGIHTIWDSLSTTYGCDSVYKLTLTVNHAVTENHTLTVCQSELPYTWRDKTFGTETAVGEHQFTYELETVQGCDSIVNLTLTVNPNNIYYDDPMTFCEGGSYEWNGKIITASGIYTDTVDNQYGCYDVNILVVTVHPVFSFSENETVCDNELPIMWQGREINQGGTHTAAYHTVNGCDSIYTLTLTVNPTYFISETATVCDNEEYVWAGHEYIQIGQRAAGTYTIYDSLNTTSFGCDSVYMLTLTVTPTYDFEPETATVCDNEEYVWPGHEYIQIGQRAAGTYTIYDYLGTMNYDCDSIHTLILTVTPTYNFEPETATVCDNEEYVWPGHEYIQIGQRTAGTYTIYDNLETSTYGCDSVHTLILTVTPTYNFEPETATVCDNEEYVWAGHEYIQIGQRTAGTYTIYDYLETSTHGCDSVHTLILTVTPTYNFQPVTATVCDNEEYVWAGHEYIQIGQRVAGTYTIYDSLSTAIFGCDSVHTLILTVTPTYNFEPVTATVCENEEYVWEGHNVQIGQRAAGTYTIYDSLSTTTFGCDSIHTLVLTVNPTKHSIENASACSNEEVYIWHGRDITATGIYYDTLETTLGCDSICELRFTLLEPTFAVFTDTTCANAEYQGYGFEVTPTLSGDTTLVRMTENVAGCDSTITVNLYVKPLVTFAFDTIYCGAFQWNNEWYTESGSYQQSFTAANGCDSIVTLNLIIDTPSRDTIEVVACESYEWDGTTYTQSGVFSKIYPQVVGCDSIAVMILTINHSTEVTLYDTTCQAHRYQEFGFDTLFLDFGTFTLHRIDENQAGCDSIINLVLTVHRGYLQVDSASTCDNDDFIWHGIHCDTTGVYYKNYETVYGCDSVFVLFLTVNPSYEVDVTDSAIAGTNYHNHGLNFTPSTPGILTIDVPRSTINGCDSIVHVTLVVTDGNGVDLRYLDKHITLFPNPTDNVFTVNSSAEIIRELTLYDNNGKAVWRQNVNDYETQVNVENLAPGLYFVRLTMSNGIVTKKLIVR